MKPRVKGRVSEYVASRILEELGYKVLEHRRKLILEGVEIGEIDLVAEKGGTLYAVEVKAGAVDVGTVRNAYANASLLGMKPLVVARGYANEAARAVAEKLGVEVVLLSDLYVSTAEELYKAVYEAAYSALADALVQLISCPSPSVEEKRVLEALASSETFAEAAGKLGLKPGELARRIAELRSSGVLRARGHGYAELRVSAALTLACIELRS